MRLTLYFVVLISSSFAATIDWQGTLGSDYLTPGNWVGGLIPAGTDTARFSSSALSTTPTLAGAPGADVSIGLFTFADNTPYTFTMATTVSRQLIFTQAGILNLGTANQTLSANGTTSIIRFSLSSSADSTGSGHVILNTRNGGRIRFADGSTASNATLHIGTPSSGGLLEFFSSSTAANSTIFLFGGGGATTATFFNNSGAGNASISANGDANLVFTNTSRTENAAITLDNANMRWSASAQANNAHVQAANGSVVEFLGTSLGNNATLSLTTGSQLTFNQINTLGSLASDSTSPVLLQANQLTVGSNGTSTAVAGPISGVGGSLVKVGGGTLTLNGINSFTGPTIISEGILAGIGSLAGDLVNNGTVAPGASTLGTFTVGGNYTQGSGATFQVAVNGTGESSRLQVNGTALQAGALFVSSPDGQFTVGTAYPIVHANGGVTGIFSTTRVSNPYFLPTVRYEGFDTFLSLATQFSESAGDPNQAGVATQIDSLSDAPPSAGENALINALATLNIPGLQDTLKQLSGIQYTSYLQRDAQYERQFIRQLDRFHPPCECDCNTSTAWLDYEIGKSHLQQAYTTRFQDVAIGAAAPCIDNDWIGLAGAYIWDHFDFDVGGSGCSQIAQAALIAYSDWDWFYLQADLIGAYSHSHVRRTTPFGNPKSHFSARSLALYVEAGFDYFFECFRVQPFVGVEGGAFERNAIHEHGAGVLNLQSPRKKQGIVNSRLGLRWEIPLWPYLNFEGTIAWWHRHAHATNKSRFAFTTFGSSFPIVGPSEDQNWGELLLSLSQDLNETWTLFAEFSGEKGSHTSLFAFDVGVQAYF